MKKLLFSLLILALLPIRAGNIGAKKITGTAATVQISTISTSVRWIQLQADAANAANVYYGDCTVTSSGTNGFVLPKGSGQIFPTGQGGYDLAQVCVYVANSDVVWVSWETP